MMRLRMMMLMKKRMRTRKTSQSSIADLKTRA
jgi:hypothetical protein